MSDTFGGSDDFISKDLTHGFVGSEAGVSGSFTHEVDSLIDSSEWGDIDSLSSDSSSGTNSSGVFSGSSLNDSLEQDGKWVLSSKKVDHLEGLSEDSDSELFLTVLSMVTDHELIDESLSDWALDLLESLLLIFTGGVWDVHLGFCGFAGKVVDEGLLTALNFVIRPFTKKHWGNSKFNSIFDDKFWFCLKKE